MMTRKDFEALADAFSFVADGMFEEANTGLADTALTGADVHKWLAEMVANKCADANPRFDYDKFLDRAQAVR